MTETNRIKFWRQQRGWTLQRLADATGTTRAQIDKLERGARRLTVDWMVRLAKPLGCDPRSLMPPGEQPHATPVDTIPLYRQSTASILQPAGFLVRPYFLEDAPDAYAVKGHRTNPIPFLPADQVLFINPQRKPENGNAVLIRHHHGRCDFYIFLRRAKGKIHCRPLTFNQTGIEDIILVEKNVTAIHPVCAAAEIPVRRKRK